MTSGEIIEKGVACLNDTKNYYKESHNGTIAIEHIKSVTTSIDDKSGYFNEVTNKRELSVKFKFDGGGEPTVKMIAYNGKCLGITGPLH